MRLLVPNGGRPLGGYVEELALQGRLALDVLDHLRDTPPVLLGREVCPAGERLEMHRVGSRELDALEGDASPPSDVLPGAVELTHCQPFGAVPVMARAGGAPVLYGVWRQRSNVPRSLRRA
jgi:hypothetical protein